MTTQKIEKQHWQNYFNELSKQCAGRNIGIEIDNLDIGAQVMTQSIQLCGITFDAKDNSLAIITPDFVHTIDDPDSIYVNVEKGILKDIAIEFEHVDDDQIIRFIPPLSGYTDIDSLYIT
jgi:hypothetical protein